MFHVKHNPPHILLLNPWITDFSAYNFWIMPLGLLIFGGVLRKIGFKISLIDCLDFYKKVKCFGDGKFFKKIIEKPAPLKTIPKNYSQYGIPEEIFIHRISTIEEKPEIICITSGMTYWYPGVVKLIKIIKDFFKEVPIFLGGIYATLCYEHALKNTGADFVFKGDDLFGALKLILNLTKVDIDLNKFNLSENIHKFTPFDLYSKLNYIAILTSQGCPFRCTYCASPILTKKFIKREPLDVVKEIEFLVKTYKIENIAFYDDALLVDAKNHFIPIMKELIKKVIKCNFHTPNALHIREIDQEVANLLYKSNFKTIRLGFETSDEKLQLETGAKVNNNEFKNAVKNLKRAGYLENEIGVYIMAGLPGQTIEEVERSILFVRETGAKPILVEYSPIPNTALFEVAKKFSKYDLENEPLFHNDSLFPCEWEGFKYSDFLKLKLKLKNGEI